MQGKDDLFGRTIQEEFTVVTTWDSMFSAIGPLLLDEGEQRALLRRLGAHFHGKNEQEAEAALAESVGEGESLDSLNVRLPADTLGTILIQFKALGLIQSSERKRSVSDTGTYWTLTPYGEDHLTSLRALRRDSGKASVTTAEDGERDVNGANGEGASVEPTVGGSDRESE
jgi:hypothetical protein